MKSNRYGQELAGSRVLGVLYRCALPRGGRLAAATPRVADRAVSLGLTKPRGGEPSPPWVIKPGLTVGTRICCLACNSHES